MPQYIPKKGDFVIVTFDPQSGHEQKGRRPALHVAIPKESSLTGYVMVEQVKSIDYKSRQIKLIEKAPSNILVEVLGILDACIYQDA